VIAFLTDGWTDEIISAANAVLAWVACCAHIYAASRTSGKLRAMFIGIGSLALFYSFAYWWLFFNPARVEEWSDFLRPISIFAWALAWAVEPVVIIRYLQRQGRTIVRVAESEARGPRQILDEKDAESC